MPDTFGKRQRRDAQVKKAAVREERRAERNRRRKQRAAGLIEPGAPIELPPIEDREPTFPSSARR